MESHSPNSSPNPPRLSTSHPHPVWSCPFPGISATWLHKCLIVEQSFCAVSSGSVNPCEPNETLFGNSKLPPLKRWEDGPDLRISDCRALCQKQLPRTEQKYEKNLHTDKAKRKITVPPCCHPDKLSLYFREFLTEDKHKEQTACLWQANTANKQSYSLNF